MPDPDEPLAEPVPLRADAIEAPLADPPLVFHLLRAGVGFGSSYALTAVLLALWGGHRPFWIRKVGALATLSRLQILGALVGFALAMGLAWGLIEFRRRRQPVPSKWFALGVGLFALPWALGWAGLGLELMSERYQLLPWLGSDAGWLEPEFWVRVASLVGPCALVYWTLLAARERGLSLSQQVFQLVLASSVALLLVLPSHVERTTFWGSMAAIDLNRGLILFLAPALLLPVGIVLGERVARATLARLRQPVAGEAAPLGLPDLRELLRQPLDRHVWSQRWAGLREVHRDLIARCGLALGLGALGWWVERVGPSWEGSTRESLPHLLQAGAVLVALAVPVRWLAARPWLWFSIGFVLLSREVLVRGGASALLALEAIVLSGACVSGLIPLPWLLFVVAAWFTFSALPLGDFLPLSGWPACLPSRTEAGIVPGAVGAVGAVALWLHREGLQRLPELIGLAVGGLVSVWVGTQVLLSLAADLLGLLLARDAAIYLGCLGGAIGYALAKTPRWPRLLLAMLILGAAGYLQVLVATKDPFERWPLRMIRRRAEAGEPRAMYELFRALDLGLWSVLPETWSHQEAHLWLRRAAEAGEPRAMHSLGRRLEVGRRVRRDLQEARLWLERAQQAGSLRSAEPLDPEPLDPEPAPSDPAGE